jgi:CubicO group peptidase (beta-lactamase class C family)
MIFQFVEEGKLKLSDTLDKFFPQIPNAGKITIAHILTHRSGIHDFIREPDFRAWSLSARTKDETLAFIARGSLISSRAKNAVTAMPHMCFGLCRRKVSRQTLSGTS